MRGYNIESKSYLKKGIESNAKSVLLAYLCIAFSAIHFFKGPIPQILFVLLSFLFINLKYYNNKKLLYIIAIFLYVIVTQSVIFQEISIYESLSILITSIIIPYIFFIYFKFNFPKFYVKALFIICIISLSFYFLSIASPKFHNSISKIPQNYTFLDPSPRANQFILYSVAHSYNEETGLLRNNGPFHEPGVFGLFLIIGFYFNYLMNKKIFNKYLIIFLISILTTFSTAAYLGLIILLLGYSFSIKKYKFVRVPLFILMCLLSVDFLLNANFLLNKIIYQYNVAMEKSLYEKTTGRFYGARKSIYVLSKYPMTGRGLIPATRPKDLSSPEFLRYGILHQFAKVGLIVSVLYLIFIFRGIRVFEKIYNEDSFTFFFIPALFANLFSQSFAFSPVLMIFVFNGIFNRNLIRKF